MTHRKGGATRAGVAEDAFGAPPAARSNVMNIAGAEDELEPGEELLVDDPEANVDPAAPGDDDYGADLAINGPLYRREGRVRMHAGALRELIRRLAKHR